jgi:hypothetical protein
MKYLYLEGWGEGEGEATVYGLEVEQLRLINDIV